VIKAALRLCGAAAAALALLLAAGPAAPDAQHAPTRVVAFADVHGAYEELTALLRAAGIVDGDLHWSAGETHAVSLGDLLDRGAGSRRVMDLLMRLQQEAAAAGGALHVLLGNHEAMNLLGDLRNTTPDEFLAYAAEAPAGLRERLRAEWIAEHGADSGGAFDQRFPPGWFGHRAALARDGRYGRWLLSLPVALVIGDTLFMHGGPSRALQGLTLDEINARYHAALSAYLDALDELTDAGLIRVEDRFAERAALAQRRLAALPEEQQAKLADAVKRFVAADADPMLSVDGPNWYRGAALCNECSERDVLNPILAALGARRLVIGHTPTRDGRVASRFEGRVIRLDAGMNREVYHGHPAALLLGDGEPRVVYADADPPQPVGIPAEPFYVTPPAIDDARVAAILAEGRVTLDGSTSAAVDATVELEGQRVRAVFTPADVEAARRELAAYRLDRALRLGLVPATVQREVDGRTGVLQARPASFVTQAEVEARSLRPDGWCALAPQFDLMYAFDAVIGNDGRTRERILYDASEWSLLLTGHAQAFGSGKALPRHLRSGVLHPGAEMRRRLAALDDATLDQALGDLLSEREIRALAARRDAVLALGR
jgi:hypothetical protein